LHLTQIALSFSPPPNQLMPHGQDARAYIAIPLSSRVQ